MEGKNTESGISQQQSSQLEINRERQPINIDLNRPSYKEEMANIRFDRITIQNNRSSSGPIKKREFRRGNYGQGGEYVSASTQASVLNNPLRTHFFPRFGSSLTPSHSNLFTGVRTGILRLHGETSQASENNNGSTISLVVRTFEDYAGSRNPWMRNTVHFRETIADSCRRHERSHPYLKPSPPPKMSSTRLQSEGSCVGGTNEENAEPEVQSGGSQDAGNAPPENQNYDINQQQIGNPDEDNSICMFCAGRLIFQDPLNRSACGHYYHFRCLVTFDKPIDHPSSCFHLVWNQIQQDD